MRMPISSASTPQQLLQLTEGLIVHQTLYAAAKLGIADLLKDGALSTAELAKTLRVGDDALYRTLRFLTGQGVFLETAPRTFANSALSTWLRADVPGSVRSIILFRGSPYYYLPFGELLYSVETGKPAREKANAVDGFEHLRRNPEEARIFDDAMNEMSALWAPAIAAAYDFGKWGTLMDVGGGTGLLLATIMRTYPDVRGVLADQAPVLERARQRGFWSLELTGRVRFEPTEFFHAVPSGCRAYLMKNVIHDWDDDRARRILINCRRAVPKNGVLLLVEYCLGDENAASLGKTVDIVMLAITGGKERTIGQHSELLATAGFRMNGIVPLSDDAMIIEAIPA
jgi:O-methyltransferase domain/Dimerisation domain